MTRPLVSIRDLHITLGDHQILEGVTADLPRGRVTALIGLNGSGKTTLLRALVKEVPYRGTITFHCGHDHSQADPRHVGYVPQKLQVDANLPLTVADLLALTLQRRPLFLGISRKTRQQMEDMLARVWLKPDVLNRYVEKISGGELQRVLLALALQPSPELLLLDEPAAGIDFEAKVKFYELLTQVNRETGMTILLVSHDTSMVEKCVHHVLCMKDGRIHCQGAPSEIIQPEVLGQIFGPGTGFFPHDHQ